MNITLNGQAHTINDGTTISELITSLDLQNKRLAVEVNQALIIRAEFPDYPLKDQDTVEIVQAIGGG
ncbi:MAG TPA: sulfur carrier protein ThiS [Thiothrix sp.]|nr:sulfur carrier protein ThiS [Thiothrix sp.]